MSGSNYFGGKQFSSPANFPRRYKATPTSRVFSLQCETELDVHSVLLVMHFSNLLFEISLVNQNFHVTCPVKHKTPDTNNLLMRR